MRNIAICISALTLLLAPGLAGAKSQNTCKMNMEITEKLFSVTGDMGTPVQLADIGCTPAMFQEMCAMEQTGFNDTATVFDYVTGEEINMSAAWFVVGSGVSTPLGSDIVAFADLEGAENFVENQGAGRIIRYDELLDMEVSFISAK